MAASDLAAKDDPLPSWNDGAAKSAILALVTETTAQGGASYVAPADRIATFDQDGTIWVSHPLYGQALFALDRLAALAPEHPEWNDTEPFKSVLAGDQAAVARFGQKDWIEILAASHAGMSSADFARIVADWLPTSKNPVFQRPVTDLVYLPMLEVMAYLHANAFRVFIVTSGGQEFIRTYCEDVYGVPVDRVVGSSIVTRYEMVDGTPALMRKPDVFVINDKDTKAVSINRVIGKRPQIAVGNSDGDREMLQWTTAGDGPRLGLLVLHDDADREFAYGPANGLPDTSVGRFSQDLMDRAGQEGWTVISMKNDWKRVFRAGIGKPG